MPCSADILKLALHSCPWGVASSEHAYSLYRSKILDTSWSDIATEELNADQRHHREYSLQHVAEGTDTLSIVLELAHQRGRKVFAEFRLNSFAQDVGKPSGPYHVYLMRTPELVLNDSLSPWEEFPLDEYKMDWAEQQVR